MSTERPAQTGAVEPSHGGPSFAWQTHFAGLREPVSRSELARSLVEEGVRPTVPAAVDMVDAAIMREELACSEEFVFLPSRQSNLNKSVNSATAANQAVENSGGERRPTIEEKVREFATEYADRVAQPMTERDGVTMDLPEFEVQTAATGVDTEYTAVEWGEAVRTLLEKYERTKQTTINLEKGDWRNPETHAEFSVEAENRWFASYQKNTTRSWTHGCGR
jgi:hypothetical protein